MKNYFKKFSIMFVMLLAVIGVGMIQNVTTANAATVGQKLTEPEYGWRRYDDNDAKITYSNSVLNIKSNDCYGGYAHIQEVSNETFAKFNFKGTKLRIISYSYPDEDGKYSISVDGHSEAFNTVYGSNVYQVLVYEITNLQDGEHSVVINGEDGKRFVIDAIDIDSNRELLKYNASIILNKSSMNLAVGKLEQLTATTTPAGAELDWLSSDSSIAEYIDGKVIGHKEGKVTITAKIKGTDIVATCEVNVTDGEVIVDPPVDGDGGLFIELVDGNIKQYDVSSDEINKFISWYNNRDNDDSQPPYYKFTKGGYKDYVIHDKIDWFEVR